MLKYKINSSILENVLFMRGHQKFNSILLIHLINIISNVYDRVRLSESIQKVAPESYTGKLPEIIIMETQNHKSIFTCVNCNTTHPIKHNFNSSDFSSAISSDQLFKISVLPSVAFAASKNVIKWLRLICVVENEYQNHFERISFLQFVALENFQSKNLITNSERKRNKHLKFV